MRTRLLLLVASIARAHCQCYLPNGPGPAGSAWSPCDPYASVSLCCPFGFTCFSNKLCIVTDPYIKEGQQPVGTTIRGACTNPRWDPACGNYCLNEPDGTLIPCGNGIFCCGNDPSCNCNTGDGTFLPGSGFAKTIIGVLGLEYTSTGPIVPVSTGSPLSGVLDITFIESRTVIESMTSIVYVTRTILKIPAASVSPVIPSDPPAATTTTLRSASTTGASQDTPVTGGNPTQTSSTGGIVQSQSSVLQSTLTPIIKDPSSQAVSTATILETMSPQTSAPTRVQDTPAFKISVGVGAGIVGVAILALIGFCMWKRWNRRQIEKRKSLIIPHGHHFESSIMSGQLNAIAPDGTDPYNDPAGERASEQTPMNREQYFADHNREENPYVRTPPTNLRSPPPQPRSPPNLEYSPPPTLQTPIPNPYINPRSPPPVPQPLPLNPRSNLRTPSRAPRFSPSTASTTQPQQDLTTNEIPLGNISRRGRGTAHNRAQPGGPSSRVLRRDHVERPKWERYQNNWQ